MSALQVAKAFYDDLQKKAARTAAASLREAGIDVILLHHSRRADEAIQQQWGGSSAGWDWAEIARRYRTPKSFCLAMWSPDDQLLGMAMITLSSEAATVRFVEGRPTLDCKYKGKRGLIALEVAANYAQGAGLSEIRIHPLNEALAHLYERTYGFEVVRPRKEEAYYRKRI